MNNGYTIDELISGYYENEFKKAANTPMPRLSLRHKLRISRIFKQYAENEKQANGENPPENNSLEIIRKPLSLRKRLAAAALIIILLALMTGFVISFVSKGFKGVIYHDNTHIFAIDTEGCPTKIEKQYSLSVVPEGYELCESNSGGTREYTLYRNTKTNQELIFKQFIKSEFNTHINTEGYELKEITINNCNAVGIEFNREDGICAIVIWEEQDYILELNCDFSLDEVIKLAEENAVNGF